MALAFLTYKGPLADALLFQADIGTSQYFKYVLGERITKLRVGKRDYIKVLDGEKRSSRLFRLKNDQQLLQGMFPIQVAKSELTEDYKYIQLYSFSSEQRTAPTISKIIRLPVYGRKNNLSEFITGLSMTTIKNDETMHDIEVKNKAHCPEEPHMSKVMFWNTIVGALPGLLKQAAPLLGGLLGGLGGGRSANSAEAQKSDDITAKVIAVLQALANNNNGQVAGQSAQQSIGQMSKTYSLAPDTLLALKPIIQKLLSPEAIEAVGDDAQKLFLAIKDAVQTVEQGHEAVPEMAKAKRMDEKELAQVNQGMYSEAKVAPALLAIMPIIEKALDPKTIEALGNQPVKLFKAVSDSLLKMDQQEIAHLEKINPGVDSADDIAKLMAGMSISSSNREELIKFKLLTNLNLEFEGTKTVPFKNKNRVLYCSEKRIVIPFKITTNQGTTLDKVLPKSVIQIVMRDSKTMKMVFRKTIKLMDVSINNTISEAFITPQETKNIPVNTELKMEVSYIWKSKNNENIGVLKSHYVHFMGSYIYDHLGEKFGDSIPLNDSQLHRKFWHKVWEGGYSKGNRWHLDIDLKYFYTLQLKNSDLARMETRIQVVDDNAHKLEELPSRRKVRAKVKSGFEWSLEAINNLMQMQGMTAIDPAILQVLKDSDITEDFQMVARQHVTLKGRDGDTGTIWVYPEMRIHMLHLAIKNGVDAYGQVERLQTKKIQVLKPESVHLIGTKSE